MSSISYSVEGRGPIRAPRFLWHKGAALILALAAAAAPAAWAASPANGLRLYNNTPGGNGLSCANASCHGTDPTQNNNNVLRGANNAPVIQRAINNNMGGMGMFSGLSASDVADIAAYLGNPAAANGPNAQVTPAALSFPATTVGVSSAAQTVTLANSGASALSISSISVSAADFTVSGGSCAAGGSVAAGASCTVLVSFKPAAAGSRSGTLSIAHNAANSPSSVSLSGSGSASTAQPAIALSAASLSFAAQNVGSSSAPQSVTVSNTGSAPLHFSAITLGGANAADFSRGGSCAVGSAVAAGASCTVAITFTPQAAGARSASVSLASDAGNGTQSLGLSGTAAAAQGVASVAPASIGFGTVVLGQQSAAQTVTLSNTGSGPLTISSIATSGSDFVVSGGSCGAGTVVAAASGSCTILLKFQPQAAGSRSGTLSVAHNGASSPATVALSGSGAAASPVAQLAPASLSFSQVVGTASAAQTLTLSNTGTAPLLLSAVTLGGTAAADYRIASGTTCAAGGSVAVNASCVVDITFTPGARGTRSASLSISHNAAGSPSRASLNGTGTAVPTGQVSVNAASLGFPAQPQGSTSAPQALTVSNSGTAPLSFSAIALGGAAAADFAIAGGSSCAAGTTLQAGGSCVLNLSFTPSVSSGTRSAQLTLSSNAANGSVVVGLSGVAAPPAAPLVSFSPASVDFGSQSIGTTSAARSVTLSNTGSAPLAIGGLSANPAQFGLSHNCPGSLAPAASCTLSLSFSPSASGALSGAVTLLSNAATSPDTLALAGTGAPAAAPALAWSSATSMGFPDTAVGSRSAVQSIGLSNPGTAPADLQQIQIAGADAADFALDAAGTCPAGGTLAAGGACTIAVAFTPGAAGPRSASLNVVSNANGLAPAALSGNGVAGGAPALSLAPSSIYLSGPPNAALQPQALVLQNAGAGVLDVTAVQAPAPLQVLDATAPGGGTCPPAPFSLQPGSSCTLMVGATGPVSNADLAISSNASATPSTVQVSGTPSTNAGAGGCSIARPGQPADPVWALMLGAAAAVLWRRRRQARRARSPLTP